MTEETVGRRIATIRKQRGMTQTALATEAHVSLSMLKKVESGHASPSSTWIGAVALALKIDAARITGGIDHAEKLHDLVPTLRRALSLTDVLTDDVQPADLDRLRLEVANLGDLRRDAKYGRIGATLPSLIDRLLVTAETEGAPAYALLTGAYRAANSLGHKMGYADLSLLALDRMQWAAAKAGDPLLDAMTKYLHAAQLARIGAERQALALLERTVGDLEPMIGNDLEAAAVYSALQMKAAHIAATVARAADSAAYIAAASEQAQRTGERVVYETVIGPTNVRLHELASAVDLGEPGRAVDIAQNTHLPEGFARERTTYFHLDAARAYLGTGNASAAVEALLSARIAAKEHFRVNGAVAAAVETATEQTRRTSDDLRRLAVWAGINER